MITVFKKTSSVDSVDRRSLSKDYYGCAAHGL